MKQIGAITEDESMTPLGKEISDIQIHPMLAKAIVVNSCLIEDGKNIPVL